MQKTTQGLNDAKKELEFQKALVDAYEKRNWKLQIENQNLLMRVSILGITTMVSIIGVLVLFFK